MNTPTTEWAFGQYESVRTALPRARFPQHSCHCGSLAELTQDFDVFLLDAYGVLNVGGTVIPSAPPQVAALQEAGKRVLVLTNDATLPADAALAKYRRLGYDFAINDVVSSREAMSRALPEQSTDIWGVMATAHSRIEELPVATRLLGNRRAEYDAVFGFLLLSTDSWENAQQELLHASLAANPRPVLVGNPDIVAPNETALSLEPGYFAHELARLPGVSPVFFGKPFGNVYDLAFGRFPETAKNRILMVGDTLHTDVLGGAAYGIKTALVTDHGLFAGQAVTPYINSSGIQPDFILPSP